MDFNSSLHFILSTGILNYLNVSSKSNPPHKYTLYLALLLQWMQQVYENWFRLLLLTSYGSNIVLLRSHPYEEISKVKTDWLSVHIITCTRVVMHDLKTLYKAKSVIVSHFSASCWIYFGDFAIFAKDKVYFICIGKGFIIVDAVAVINRGHLKL